MNKRKNILIILIIVIAFVIIKIIAFFKQDEVITPGRKDELFRDTTHLILTKHVKCRMECRHINLQEIQEIIKEGNENYAKTGEGSKGDKTYALEGYSTEHQHIRVVVAPENDGLVVITCIDLDKEWPCNCN